MKRKGSHFRNQQEDKTDVNNSSAHIILLFSKSLVLSSFFYNKHSFSQKTHLITEINELKWLLLIIFLNNILVVVVVVRGG